MKRAALAGAVAGCEAAPKKAQHGGGVDDAALAGLQACTGGGAGAHGAVQVDVHVQGDHPRLHGGRVRSENKRMVGARGVEDDRQSPRRRLKR